MCPEADAVPLSEAVLFLCLGFLVEKYDDVYRNPPSSSCDVYQFGDGYHIYFPFLFFPLYEEGGDVEP